MTPDVRGALLFGVASAAAAAAALLGARALRRARRRARDRAVTERERQPERRAELCRMLGLDPAALPDLGGWKIAPDFACLLVDLVRDAKPRRVLELGCGSSTVVLACALRGRGGVVASLEQDAEHAEATRRMLRERGIDAGVRVVHAPLTPRPGAAPGEPAWYAEDAIASFDPAFGPPWDLLVVDGPSSASRADARKPALPRLLSSLSARAVIVLDDAARPGERAVIEAWRARGFLDAYHVKEVPLARGAVVMRRLP